MWCPEGYVTFGEIYAQILWESDIVPTATNRPQPPFAERFHIDTGEIDFDEVQAFQIWASAGFFRIFREDLRVCLPSGGVVRLEQSLAIGLCRDPLEFNSDFGPFPSDYDERIRISKWEFTYIDLNYGCVRSRDPQSSLTYLNGLPICIKEARLPVTVDKLPAWLWNEIPKLDAQQPPLAWSSREDAAAIVQAFNNGKIRTKPEAKQMFGRDLPTAAWQALWDEAVAIKPSLSRPGRR